MNHELNALVAREIMGWTKTESWSGWGRAPNTPVEWDGAQYVTEIPDYSGSLDAAWQMEEEIERRGLCQVYVGKLMWALWDGKGWPQYATRYEGFWFLIRATSEQRCRAALTAVREK